jgi:hypothetical protein
VAESAEKPMYICSRYINQIKVVCAMNPLRFFKTIMVRKPCHRPVIKPPIDFIMVICANFLRIDLVSDITPITSRTIIATGIINL